MKRKPILLSIIFLFLFLFLVSAPMSYAATIDITEIIWQEDATLDPFSLSAEIDFTYVDTTHFTATITNTSSLSDPYPTDYPAPVILTGFGFNLGLNNYIDGGSVDSENLVGSLDDPSGYWGYDNIPTSGYFKQGEVTTNSVDTVVSTMTAAVENIFLDNSFNKNPIQGPNWGVMSSAYSGTNAYPYFEEFVVINIALANAVDWNTFIAYVNSNDVVVAFGSPTAPIPEPATMLLLGTGLIVLAGIGRKKFFKIS